MKKLLSFVLVLAVLISGLSLFSTSASAITGADITLYASPDADGKGSGTNDSPYTLLQAKNELKKYKSSGKTAVVYLLGGTYFIDKVLDFNSEDMPNVTYKAYNGQVVEFSGAEVITGFTEGEINGVKVFKKQLDTSAENWYFKTLFSDRCTLSITRYPETGYFTVKGLSPEDDLWTPETAIWEYCLGQSSFYFDKNDIKSPFKNTNDVNVRILHYWHDELAYIKELDLEKGKLTMSRPSGMNIREIDRYYFENVFEALDKSGEYYVDRSDGVLYYVPFENENADSLTLYGSHTDKLVKISGVDSISFEGVRFARTDWEIPEADGLYEGSWQDEYNVDFPQAAMFVDGVVEVEYAENIHFRNCEFKNLGGTALKFKNGVRDSSVQSCYFEEIAATAIYVGGTNCLPGEADFTSNITIKNNEIYKYGRKFFCGIGIHITYCDTAEVVNNEIHDGYYTGISVGWVWGYAYHVTRNINVSRNLIYNIGQGWLSDMGGIYMLGKQPGTRLTENVIHNVAADPGEGGYGGWGVYLDEGSSFMTVEKNLLYCCGSQGLNIHYGEGNIIRNNISALSGEGQVNPGVREEDHATAFYYNNIFLTYDKVPVYVNMQDTQHFYDNGNLMWSLTEGDELYFNITEDSCTLGFVEDKGFINNPLVTDPLFKNPTEFDFTLAEDSPVFTLNFDAWDYSLAGTLRDTVVGLSKQGGKTAYNDSAEHIEAKTIGKISVNQMVLPNIGIAVSLLFLLVWVVILMLKKDKNVVAPFVAALFIVPVFAVVYTLYIEWIEIPYYICAVVIGALATVLPVTVSRVKEKSKKSVTITGIISFILSVGGFLGVAGIMNMILGSDEPGVVLTAIGFIIVSMVVQTIRLLKATKK